MSDYTPTTGDVEEAWCSRYDGEHSWASAEERRGYEAEFDRWLDQTLLEAKAEVWEEGHIAAAMRVPEGVWHDTASPRTHNPYRQDKDS